MRLSSRLHPAIGLSVFLGAVALAWFFVTPFFANPEISYTRSLEIGDEVIVRFGPFFSESEARGQFRIDPAIEGELTWLEDDKELHFVPREGFVPGQEYRVIISSGENLFAALSPPTRAFTFTSLRASVSDSLTAPAVAQGKYLDVNLSTMVLTLLENGLVVRTYPIAGKGNPWLTPTREGTFRILSKEPRHFSSIYKVWQPNTMRYSGSYSIHGWPYWPNGRRLTSVYSGGCIRLKDEIAKEVYDWVEVGTPVVVHSTPGRVPLLSLAALTDGDMAREESDYRVFVLKHAGEKRFKRHVLSESMAIWYPHLAPFRSRVKVVSDGTLASYRESRWVRTEEASDGAGNRYIYEINPPPPGTAGIIGTRHLMLCGDLPESLPVGPEKCMNAWNRYGWDTDELYTVSSAELSAYAQGEPITLPSAQNEP